MKPWECRQALEKRGRVRECGHIKLRVHKVHNGSRWGDAMSHKFEEGRRMCVWPQAREVYTLSDQTIQVCV